jgi:hypothetical protein
MKYCYGTPDKEYYYAEDLTAAYEEICADHSDLDNVNGLIIVEMAEGKKSGVRFCQEELFFEPDCGNFCVAYRPVNGKSGICKSLHWGLYETGATWEIIGEYEYKKLTGRRKK